MEHLVLDTAVYIVKNDWQKIYFEKLFILFIYSNFWKLMPMEIVLYFDTVEKQPSN